MSDTGLVVLVLAASYAVLGAVLLALLVYARLDWRLKAAAIVLTSVFYVVDFAGARALLGWASPERLPHYFKLLQARVVEPDALAGETGAIYLWVEALGDDNRTIAAPRAYRLPYTVPVADRTDQAIRRLAEGKPQGGLTDDTGRGTGVLADTVKPHVNGETSIETGGGDPSDGALQGDTSGTEGVAFLPLLPPRMPAKDVPHL